MLPLLRKRSFLNLLRSVRPVHFHPRDGGAALERVPDGGLRSEWRGA